jgi:hypothetical protein
MWYRWFYKAPLFLILGGAFAILVGYVVMLLWNALIPMLFHGPVLTFWQAVGMLVLLKILFHNHRVGSWHSHGWHPSYHKQWKERLHSKMASMTPEDKARFKDEWHRRCSPRYWDHFHSEERNGQPGDEKKE